MVINISKKCSGGGEENVFLSPFSISAALVMVFAGARGATQDQIRQVMRLEQIGEAKEIQDAFEDVVKSMKRPDQVGLTLLNANGVYIQDNLLVLPEYKEMLQTKFDSVLKNVNFVKNGENVRIDINTDVEKVTRNRIKDLITPGIITSDTRLILVNAIYFKGDWMSKFDPKRTREAQFTISESNTKKVNMMHQKGYFRYSESDELQCSMVDLPYVDERLGMCILLPSAMDGLASLESELNKDSCSKLLELSELIDVDVSLPRFKIESSFSLNDSLKVIGMQTMFTSGADFNGITITEPLYVSAVLHKAFLEVNEEGSEAAAATSAMVEYMCACPEFRADHPFLVLIRDNYSGLVLFLGRVKNP